MKHPYSKPFKKLYLAGDLVDGCPWYKGESGTPNLKLCKTCIYKRTCVGRKYLKKKEKP